MENNSQNIVLVRQQFLTHGVVEKGAVADTIARSWQRCLINGVDVETPNNDLLTRQELAIRIEQNSQLITHAEPEMITLCEQIAHTQSMVVLSDREGIILSSMGHSEAMSHTQRASLLPGASWSEADRGTNAIGTALMEQSGVSVQGAEHFMRYHHRLSCSAVPIFGADNALLGTLDVSNNLSTPQQHTLALVKMASQMIENRLFYASHRADFILHFHARPEFIGTLWEGIAMFSDNGELIAMNRSGQFQLNMSIDREALSTNTIKFDQLFDTLLSSLIKQVSSSSNVVFPLRLSNGARVFARMDIATQPAKTELSQIGKRASAASLEMLTSHDPQISLAIQQVKQVLNRQIPILIQGETGAGKELFARAIHEASNRRHGPWVAVNCAALPEGLIEAELFGYEEGAFTGAKRKGSVGKIEQANGGTLFLDEIGDMPLSLQARLLRVLQERSVTPLGSTKSQPVDFDLVSATNQKLKDKVASSEFRSDLYYRINGLSVNLPALRERTDLKALIQFILQIEHVAYAEITPNAMQILEIHPWPGNIRQLHNVLRTALALADGAPIDVTHFTQDFLDELSLTSVSVDGVDTSALKSPTQPLPLKTMEDNAIERAMQQHQGNISAVARQLGISRNTLYRKLRLSGLL